MPISGKKPLTDNFSDFKMCLFEPNESLSGCKLIISTIEHGALAYNSLMETIWEIDANYIGYGFYQSKALVPRMMDLFNDEKTSLPGTSFPLYRKGNILFLPVNVVITTAKKEEYTSSLIEWVYNTKISEIFICGSVNFYQAKSGDQIHFYSRQYIKNHNPSMKYIRKGFGFGGEGPLMFINSDFLSMTSAAVFIACSEANDNLKFIPNMVKIIVSFGNITFNYKKWKQKFLKEYEQIESSNDDDMDNDEVELSSGSDFYS